MYLTPILYPLTLVPESVRPWVAANPFGWLVDAPARRAARRPSRARSGATPSRWSSALALFFGGRWVFRRLVAAFRGFPVDPERELRSCRYSRSTTSARTTRRSTRAAAAFASCSTCLRGRGAARVFRALDGVTLRDEARRIARRHRRERRRQVDAAQDHRRRRSSPRAARSPSTAASARCSSWDRIPSRIHRAREHRPRRGAARPRAARDRREARRDHRVRRHRRAHPRSDQALLVRNGRAAGLRDRDRARARGAHHRRGARGRRRVVPEEVHRVDGALPRGRRHAAPVLAQHVPRPEAVPHAHCGCEDGRVERYGRRRRSHAGVPRLPRGEERRDAKNPVAPSVAAAAGIYAIQSLELEPAGRHRAGRGPPSVRRGLFAGRPRAGRADRHRSRRRHADLRRGDGHGWRCAATASRTTATPSR